MTRHTLFLLFIFGLCCAACSASKKSNSSTTGNLERPERYMTGSFNSSAQAKADTNYYDITLHMYPIWKDREGHWLYVEQAVTTAPGRPYRQRVYQLAQKDKTTFESRVYTLQNPKDFIGAWATPDVFKLLTFSEIQLKKGCEVLLKKQPDGSFSGATGHRTCPSELRGASYATSEVAVFSDKIISWDQGFNAADEQVWGATKGGYEFVKVKK